MFEIPHVSVPTSVGPKYGRFRALFSDLCGLFSSWKLIPTALTSKNPPTLSATNTDTWFAVTHRLGSMCDGQRARE